MSEIVTGSHFPKRICRTNAQWDAIRRAALERQAEMDRQRRACGNAC